MTDDGWELIDTAPRDGMPIWARGWNMGREAPGQRHCTWAYWSDNGWNGAGWYAAGTEGESLLYLTHWKPAATRTGGVA